MIIEAKATKTSSTDDASDPYGFTEEKPSRKPMAIAALLTGLALYLKSVFPGWSEAAPQESDEPVANKPTKVPDDAQLALDDLIDRMLDPISVRGTADLAGFGTTSGSGGRLIDPEESAAFLTVDDPDLAGLDIVLPEAPPVRGSRFASPQPAARRSANDNGGAPTNDDGDADLQDLLDEILGSGTIFPGEIAPDEDDRTPDEEHDNDDDDDAEENRAPRSSGPLVLNDVFGCGIAVFALAELIANASDPDGDPLSIANLTISSGTITQVPGGWSFAAALLGPVTLTYEITDGALKIVQQAFFNVRANLPVIGTADDDLLVGSVCADEIAGGCGDDNIDARDGDDTIDGGPGDDHIVAGNGGDVVRAGDGDDWVFGGAGMDWISGGAGNDRLFGGDDDDVLFGDEGDDEINGDAGDDLLFGGVGNDRMFGGAGNDELLGGEGNDRIAAGDGEDIVLAEAGDDTVIGDADRADDTYDGGEGDDLVDYSAVTGSIEIDLEEGEASGAAIGVDQLSGFEAVATGSGDDWVVGSECDDTIDTGGGDDRIEDGGGTDTVLAGSGDDQIRAALDAVADTFDGGEGTDTLDYSATRSAVFIDLNEHTATGVEIGTDTVTGFEAVIGGSGNDHFVVVDSPVSLTGGDGEDVFEFQAAAGDSAGSHVVHDILDFMVGDRIKVSKYEIFDEVMDSIEHRFEDIYGDAVEKESLPIRIRHEATDTVKQTFIDVDFDNDDIYEMTINISGDHVLLVVDNGTAAA